MSLVDVGVARQGSMKYGETMLQSCYLSSSRSYSFVMEANESGR